MQDTNEKNNERNGMEIAVIGMSGRFPGAKNTREFWENLKNGVNSIAFFTEEELLVDSYLEPVVIKDPTFVKAKGVIEEFDFFDAFFFGYSPFEAEVLDPQIRIFYELCWEALEDGACDPSTYPGAIGVYAGGTGNRWWEILTVMSGKTELIGNFASNYLIDKDVLATRMAYRLDLSGPAITIHTACSTALVAVDLAVRGLLTSQCDAALAGGVSINTQTAKGGGNLYKEGMIQSPDGNIRTFDARAKGVVFSDGAGVVLLKRLDDAIDSRDHIYAVIKSSSTNNDGIGKTSFTAPAVDGQAEAIRTALYMAEVEPESITYVETHGTATEIGDPIEVEALKTTFNTNKKQYCALGSVKTNIGHADTGAGIASFIKAVLAVHHGLIPPSLNFETPNPKIDFENSPFYVNTKLRQWENDQYPLRAGVSSFGVGGTNAHVILEQAPVIGHRSLHSGKPGKEREYQLVVLSARSANALQQATTNFLTFIKEYPGTDFADIAYTLKTGRKAFEHRKMLVCQQIHQAIEILEKENKEPGPESEAAQVFNHITREETRPVFMFPGQGSQYVEMARGLYELEAVFQYEMDRCFEILDPLLDHDIKEILYPSAEGHQSNESNKSYKSDIPLIDQTEITQPVLFIIEYALAKLLMSWGIQPFAMIGHSIGEYVAAALSGVFSLEQALEVVVWRGRLMQQQPPGSMLSVTLPERELTPLMPGELALAAVNAPSYCVISGPHQAIADFTRDLEQKGYQNRKLHTSHAFHSYMMEPMLKPFAEKVSRLELHPPTIPFISNVSGDWITAEEAAEPGYWVEHVKQTVRFSEGVSQLLQEPHAVFIEVGPGHTLSTFVRQHTGKKPGHHLVNLVRHPREEVHDQYSLLTRLGFLWLYGVKIDWQDFYAREQRHRLQLPTYPFQRQRYWTEGNPLRMIEEGKSGQFSTGKKTDIAQWAYTPCWLRSLPLPPAPRENKTLHWLVLVEDNAPHFVDRLVQALVEQETTGKHQENENTVTLVKTGNQYREQTHDLYTIRPGKEVDYETLIKKLQAAGRTPGKILHLLNLTDAGKSPVSLEREPIETWLDRSFYSLLFLVQALEAAGINQPLELIVLTNGMQEVGEEPVLFPHKAAVLGPVLVTPREMPQFTTQSIDIVLPSPGENPRENPGENQPGKIREERLIRQLLKEFHTPVSEDEAVIAFRGNYRYKRSFEPVKFSPATDGPPPCLRSRGVYLITGGLGGIGLELAQYLARTLKANLILTSRTALPPAGGWEAWLQAHDSLDPISRKIRKVKELESMGARVLVLAADVTDLQGMQQGVEQAISRYGPIQGVIHAAGLPGGGLIQLKTRETAQQVLDPKIKGTLVLDRVLQRMPLDFFILCSSINSVIPVLGQVDYLAANAFMDAFAFYKRAAENTLTVSINWDAWKQVGMAVEAARRQKGEKPEAPTGPRSLKHPLLNQVETITQTPAPGQRMKIYVFTTYFSFQGHFVLSDHMTREGKGLVPGVTYLEMARAALDIIEETQKPDSFIEIRGVSFRNPLLVEPAQEREVRTILKPLAGSEYEFLACSPTVPGGKQWQEHALGKIARVVLKENQPAIHSIPDIEAQCTREEIDSRARRKQGQKSSLMVFGPHWENMVTVKMGKNQALGKLELPGEFIPEFHQYGLYPPLLDNATAFLFDHIDNKNEYIPYAYKNLKVYRPFTPRMYSFNRLAPNPESHSGFLTFNILLLDEQGREVVKIEEFTMLELSGGIIEKLKEKDKDAGVNPGPPAVNRSIEVPAADMDEGLVKDGILSWEGVEVFRRILFDALPQMVISTRDLESRKTVGQVPGGPDLPGKFQQNQEGTYTHARPDISSNYVAPHYEPEQRLARIWQELLGIEQVGVLDDFFELGGDSLKANIMVTRIKKEFNTQISVRDIFNTPRVRDLTKQFQDKEEIVYTAVEPAEQRRYYPIAPMQKRLYILSQIPGVETAYNLAYGLIVTGQFDRQRGEQAFQLLIRRHDIFRTSFELKGNEPVQVIHQLDTAGIHLFYSDVGSGEINHRVREFVRPFDLTRAPLMRVGLFKTSGDTHLLLFDIHHIICDGISSINVVQEFFTLYAGGGQPALPPLKLQYKDFCVWQTREPVRHHLQKQQEYWLNQFKGRIPVLELFTDFPRPRVQEFAGEQVSFQWDRAFTRAVELLIKETNATLYIVLLAAFTILLSKYSNQEDIIVGVPVAGRSQTEFADIIGLFVNTLPMRNYPHPDKTCEQFLQEVKENTLEAHENQGYPFGDLIETLGLTRDISRNPLYDVELVVQNMSRTAIEVEGLKFSYYRHEAAAAQLDISLEVWPIEENIQFLLTYSTGLFKRETIENFIDFYKKIITHMSTDRKIKIKDISIPHRLGKARTDQVEPGKLEFGF